MRSVVIAIPLILAVVAAGCGKNSSQAARDQPSQAQVMFETKCAVCHGFTGAGDGPSADAFQPRPHNETDPVWQASVTDDQIKEIILRGGVKLGKSPAMPGNPRLRERPEVLDGLVKLIRGFGKLPREGSAPAHPLTPRP